MDPMISLGQNNTLTEYLILSGADNRPPKLDKDLYDFGKVKMECIQQNRSTKIVLKQWKMLSFGLRLRERVAKDLLERVQLANARYIFGQSRKEEFQMNHQISTVPQVIPQVAYQSPQALTHLMTESPFVDSAVASLKFPIPIINSELPLIQETKPLFKMAGLQCNKFREDKGNIILIEDLDTYDSDCDDLLSAQAVLMANISNYGSDVISEVPNSETYLNDMDNQSVHAL
ncbi:hypothetical protein Tco_0829640 [Tanacetum coccineum]